MTDLPLLPKATAVWLVENTALTFEQVAEFTGMHELEIAGIADGEVAIGIKGLDPVMRGQLTREEIARCEADPKARLRLMKKTLAPEAKRKAPRYTPLSKRQDRPAAIAWLVRYHPELADSQIAKLVGTTKPTIASVRDKSHWNMPNIRPVDPVALGLCKQGELDAAVAKAVKKAQGDVVMSDAERMRLVSTEQSLTMDPEPRLPSSIAGLETFTLTGSDDRDHETPERAPSRATAKQDAERLFTNLEPADEDDDDR